MNQIKIKQKVSKYSFLGRELYLQESPARFAKSVDKPIFPMTIVYNDNTKKHIVQIGEAIQSHSINEMMSKCLASIGNQLVGYEHQIFHDLVDNFSKPY